MKKKGFVESFRRKQYVIAGAVVVAAVVVTTAVYSNRQEQERKQLEAELAQELEEPDAGGELADAGDTEEMAEASALIVPEKKTEIVEETAKEETEAIEEDQEESEEEEVEQAAAVAETLHFSPSDGMVWPMEGNVILNYSMDSTVYFATLDQYKYNPAVIIAGDVNSKVYSAARGRVESIVQDAVTGCTMTVDLGDGYRAVYGQLKELNFKEGDMVEAGHVLGYISEPTKYFSVEGSNLYFQLQKDGTPVDPVEFFD